MTIENENQVVEESQKSRIARNGSCGVIVLVLVVVFVLFLRQPMVRG
jgi:hypothetical protein